MNPNPSQFGNYSQWAQENMANGASAQDLQQTLQQSGINPNQASTPTSQGSQPSWLEKLLPTAGGVLGGIGGEALDVFGGGVAGAAAGDAAGKALENGLTGQSATKGLVGSAIEGGLGQGVGNLAGGAIKGALGLASKGADIGATSALQAQAKGALDPETSKILSDMGLTDLRQVGQIAPLITKSNGALSTGVKTALADTDTGVDISGLDKIANGSLAEHGAKDKAIQTVNRNLASSMKNMVNPEDMTTAVGTKGNSTVYSPGALQNALPENVFKQSQKMDSLASQSFNKAYDKMGNVTNVEELNKGLTYSKLGDELESRAFGSNGTPLALTQDAKDAIIQKLAPVKDINPDVYNKYVADVSKATNVQDLRALQAPMVRGSKAVQAAGNIGATKGLAANDIARATVGIAKNPVSGIGQIAMASPMADRGVAAALKTTGKVAGKAAASKIVPTIARAGAITGANLPNDVGTPAQTLPAQTANIGGAMQPPQNQLQQAVAQALQMQQVAPLSNSMTGATSILDALAPAAAKQSLAQPVISNLLNTYNQAGGAQGTAGGFLSKLTGLIPGTAANTYQNAQSSAADQLASILGITPQAAQAMFPQLMQSPQTAANSTGTLQGILGGVTPSPLQIPVAQ